MKPKEKPHYVNNADFSQAVVDYVQHARDEKEKGNPIPVVTNYIAECFLKIAEGLSHKANFVRYTYREEMVMDAVENCLKAIDNYNLETATRTGKPNAFAYFTQIAWYAFLRRIEKEKRQQDIKMRYLSESGLSELVSEEIQNDEAVRQTQAFVDELRERIDVVR
jgi:DNA-directed RNA polymerase specialized sigma24 family protein